ncbi:hypothetical protein E4T56_gene1581 [Termitomyces sp. T112]|nr:hypothetical protein E4T56_gene1581 [Termitomyces sp. T112]
MLLANARGKTPTARLGRPLLRPRTLAARSEGVSSSARPRTASVLDPLSLKSYECYSENPVQMEAGILEKLKETPAQASKREELMRSKMNGGSSLMSFTLGNSGAFNHIPIPQYEPATERLHKMLWQQSCK